MKTEHTPGPWVIKRYTNYTGFSIFSKPNPDFGCIAERWEEIDEPERNATRLANAQLIAAAPEMFDLLEDFIMWVDDDHKSVISGIVIRANEILSKIKEIK